MGRDEMSSPSLLTTYREVAPFLPSVVAAADSHKNELGFLPGGAYEILARQAKLVVALQDGKYAGHLLYGGCFPALRVVQAFVLPEYRRNSIAYALIEHLKALAVSKGYISISASVAEDLDKANKFWAAMGFRAVTQKAGGVSRGRKIIVREYVIPNNSLFDFPQAKAVPEFIQVRGDAFGTTPSFALDLCVLFDLVKKRARADEAGAVIRQAMTGAVRLFVTQEFIEELDRNRKDLERDSIFEFARNLPVLPEVDDTMLNAKVDVLRQIVFPTRNPARRRAQQDQSDLRHLASAMHHGLDGFITREQVILQKADELQEQTGFGVLSSADFISGPEPGPPDLAWSSPLETSFEVKEIAERERAVCSQFLEQSGHNAESVKAILSSGTLTEPRRRYWLKNGSRVAGVATWTAPSPALPGIAVYLLVEDACAGNHQFIGAMLELMMRDVSVVVGQKISLAIGINQSVSLQLARSFGFELDPSTPQVPGFTLLRKFSFSGAILPEGWSRFASALAKSTGITLDPKMPKFDTAVRDGLKILNRKQKADFIPFGDLETYLRPVLFLFPGREGVMIPIRPSFAADLLGQVGKQLSFLPGNSVSLKAERAYFRKPKGKFLKAGMPIVFYASGGIGEAIGCARMLEVKVRAIEEIEWQVVNDGVLTTEQLREQADDNGKVQVIRFSGFQPFRCKVSIPDLREMKADKGNFISAQRLTPEQLRTICKKGFGLSDAV